MNLLVLMREVYRRPQMYVGDVTFDRIEVLLIGFIIGSDREEDRSLYQRFEGFVHQKFNDKSTRSWASLVREKHPLEEDSLSVCLLLLIEFVDLNAGHPSLLKD